MRKNSLKFELITKEILNIIITIISISIIVLFTMDGIIRKEIEIKNDILISSVEFQIESYLEQAKNQILQIKEILYDQRGFRYLDTNEILRILVDKNSRFSDVYILDKEGIVFYSQPYDTRVIGTDQSLYPYFNDEFNVDEVYWSSAFFSYNSTKPQVALSMRVKSGDIVVGILNLDELGNLLKQINKNDENILAITDNKGTYIAHSDMKYVYEREIDPYFNDFKQNKNMPNIDYKGVKVTANSKFIRYNNWAVIIYQSHKEITKPLYNSIYLILICTVFLVIFAFYMNYNKVRKIMNNILNLENKTKSISEGNYDEKIDGMDYKELNSLSSNFNKMIEQIQKREAKIKEGELTAIKLNEKLEAQVRERTRQLLISNNELAKSLEEVKTMQEELVQSKKMEALKDLVTGIAHELNTPIGIAITASSYVENLNRNLDDTIKNGKISGKDIKEYMDKSKKLYDSMSVNLRRASKLIELFKKLSIEPINQNKEEFNVKNLIRNTVTSVNIGRSKDIKIKLKCDDNVIINSYKTPFATVISSIIKNSLDHAFVDREKGEISINVTHGGDYVVLEITDDGVGIDFDNKNKVFHPFFTTARGSGLVGLGLNIVYNIVDRLFKGTITFNSDMEKGTTFTILIPLGIDVMDFEENI
ncbi:MAG: ATP-binding protein [Peptostreptococcaceae bacterium]|jgi:signal transduction histidine kinase|nr:ATP-binding protein [Peptostreptococcaceae bacterium]